MSATSQAVPVSARRGSRGKETRALLWILSSACLTPIVVQSAMHFSALKADLPDLLPWAALLALVHLVPVSAGQFIAFAPDTPVLVAGMLVLEPPEVAVITLIGAFDPREFRGQITLTRAVFNRVQSALSALLGSVAIHTLVRYPASSTLVVVLALLALAISLAANCALVSLAVSLDRGWSIRQIMNHLRIGTGTDFAMTSVLWAVLGAVLAALYDESRPLALLAFLGVTILGRQALARSQMLVDTSKAYRSREQALHSISQQIVQERFDERRLIAAELHDEVLQPLFKVTLMAQVIKNDLSSGRLLELDQDLPELLTGADLASSTLRELIGDLRRSALGRGGLAPALNRFVQNARGSSQSEVHIAIDVVEAKPDVELVTYQIAKEALTNALTHGRARNIWIALFGDHGELHLTIRDDGVGFDPSAEPPGHFGLQIMNERAAAVGGFLQVESWPGQGCQLRFSAPLGNP